MTHGAIEEWRALPSGKYSVSSIGNVIVHINKTHPERRQIALLRQYSDKDGYRYLRLSKVKWLIHRLVYATFAGPLIKGLVVCHMDGDKANNAVSNLLQTTQRENISHKIGHGTHQIGQKHGRALYSDALVAEVRAAISAAPKGKAGRLKHGARLQISQSFNVSPNLVTAVASGKAWRHV